MSESRYPRPPLHPFLQLALLLASVLAIPWLATHTPSWPEFERLMSAAAPEFTQTTGADSADLKAQQSMASSAWLMVKLAGLQLFVAVAGAVGLAVTLIYTHRSLQATREALTSQQETARRQLRAYVGVTGAHVSKFGPVIQAKVTTTNRGQTPAFDVRISLETIYQLAADVPSLPELPAHYPSLTLNPTEKLHSTRNLARALTPEELALLQQTDCAALIVIFGKVTYRDIFGEEWSCCFASDHSGVNAEHGRQYPIGNHDE